MEDFIAPLLELFNNKDVQERMEETARIYFTSNNVTVNLVWSFLIFGLLGLLLKPLFGIPLLDNILGAMTGGGGDPAYGSGISGGYGAPDAGYGAPDAGYGAPDAGYGAPDAGYGAPDAGYDAPDSGYDAPASGGSGYDAPSSGYDSPDTYGSPAAAAAPAGGYSAPQSGYSRGKRSVTLTADQKSLYSNLVNSLPSSSADLLTHRFTLASPTPLGSSTKLLN